MSLKIRSACKKTAKNVLRRESAWSGVCGRRPHGGDLPTQ
jgi:hypothetical protein